MGNRPGDETDSRNIRKSLQRELSAVDIELTPRQMEQLETHFELLIKWNQKINLTAIRELNEIAARHFGESLFLSNLLPEPKGLMVDVGSGGGFPGLPLKIAWPETHAILLEPNHKKETFLKEVIRSCGLEGIEVRAEWLEEAAAGLEGRAALVTMRAVRHSKELLLDLAKLLQPEGRAALFLGAADAASITASSVSATTGFEWQTPTPIPHSDQRVILIGHVVSAPQTGEFHR